MEKVNFPEILISITILWYKLVSSHRQEALWSTSLLLLQIHRPLFSKHGLYYLKVSTSHSRNTWSRSSVKSQVQISKKLSEIVLEIRWVCSHYRTLGGTAPLPRRSTKLIGDNQSAHYQEISVVDHCIELKIEFIIRFFGHFSLKTVQFAEPKCKAPIM